MSGTTSQWARRAVIVALSLAVGACVAAMNWYSIWKSFARLDVTSGGGTTSLVTVEAQADFQRWVLVTLVSLLVAGVAMATLVIARSSPGRSQASAVQEERGEAARR